MTKTQKLLNAFRNGDQLTSKQISARFGIKNPTAAVTSLRQAGYPIYFNERKNRASSYKLGTASRAVIAAGYKALATVNG
jgi:hypothetical protein